MANEAPKFAIFPVENSNITFPTLLLTIEEICECFRIKPHEADIIFGESEYWEEHPIYRNSDGVDLYDPVMLVGFMIDHVVWANDSEYSSGEERIACEAVIADYEATVGAIEGFKVATAKRDADIAAIKLKCRTQQDQEGAQS